MKFYTSDLHFGHNNVIKLDGRPYNSLDEMHEDMIARWNSVVSKGDDVYVLGDATWKSDIGLSVLKKLNGRIHLIRGNHDSNNIELIRFFASMRDYDEISDTAFGEDYRVIMCHYPIVFYRSNYDPHKVMLCGHVHDTEENKMLDDIIRQTVKSDSISLGQIINVGCMLHDYTPQTLEQLLTWWKSKYKGDESVEQCI